jgi:hypothetical protein
MLFIVKQGKPKTYIILNLFEKNIFRELGRFRMLFFLLSFRYKSVVADFKLNTGNQLFGVSFIIEKIPLLISKRDFIIY